jgi:hypothetical protein
VQKSLWLAAFISAALATLTTAANGQTAYSYWIWVRSFQFNGVSAYLPASQTQTSNQSAAYQACDGNTYYLAASDYQTLSTSLGNNSITIQLNVAPQGSDAGASGTRCVIQAAN